MASDYHNIVMTHSLKKDGLNHWSNTEACVHNEGTVPCHPPFEYFNVTPYKAMKDSIEHIPFEGITVRSE